MGIYASIIEQDRLEAKQASLPIILKAVVHPFARRWLDSCMIKWSVSMLQCPRQLVIYEHFASAKRVKHPIVQNMP